MPMPTCWIIAGPNGAGKTTFALDYLPAMAGCENFVNADLIAAGLSPLAPQRERVAAGRLFLREIRAYIGERREFAFETTLAGRSYLRLVDELRRGGWHTELVYLALPSVEMAKMRVAERVAHGGHDIPEADIERRFPRSLRNLFAHYAPAVTRARCFMSHRTDPELVFTQAGPARTIVNKSDYELLLLESGL